MCKHVIWYVCAAITLLGCGKSDIDYSGYEGVALNLVRIYADAIALGKREGLLTSEDLSSDILKLSTTLKDKGLIHRSESIYDPWGNQICYMYVNQAPESSEGNMKSYLMVWSLGTDEKNSFGKGDDIVVSLNLTVTDPVRHKDIGNR